MVMYPREMIICHHKQERPMLFDPGTEPFPRISRCHEEERLIFNPEQLNYLRRSIEQQKLAIYHERLNHPQFLVIGLIDYRNLLVLHQKAELTTFDGMTIIVMPEEEFEPMVLLSPADELSKAFWNKQ